MSTAQLICPKCGWNELVYSSSGGTFFCQHCGTESDWGRRIIGQAQEKPSAQRKKEVDTYLDTIGRLEPDISAIDASAYYASASISLKRLADALERIAKRLEAHRPAGQDSRVHSVDLDSPNLSLDEPS